MNTRILKTVALLIFMTLLMVMSLSISSCSVMAGLFATPTSTPTLTFTPTATPTPTSTPTPTPTYTPTPSPTPVPTGKHVMVMEDGSYVFVDYDLKYGMIYPSTWYVIPFDSEEEEAATEKLVAVDPGYKDLLSAFGGLMDFVALKPDQTDPKDVDASVSGLAIEGEVYVQLPLKDALASQEVPEGATVIFNDIVTNASGVEMGLLEYESEGAHTIVGIFKTEKGMVVISIATPMEKFESMYQEIVDIIGAIGLIEQ